ncbi:MAG: MBL fold metallo-hydrolase [Burkholderiales bacterium]|jgi:glyoxylase-like metal-dependent hydrolase (beta-lactamase superfamily II)|nr:MBL fold metallo-hydrolase [Burkholderiales bacterium]
MSTPATIVPGEIVTVAPGVRRITAPNPGVMTGPGTNSYLIGDSELALIDPGPELDAHRDALLAAAGGRLRWILCTHTHRDHSPLARALQQATGARVLGHGRTPSDGRQDETFKPDRVLRDGEIVDCAGARLRVVHTPGHASNHLCYLLEGSGLLFTGDHVMQGSTVVISPPDGDMQVYLDSLERLLELPVSAFAPGHGHVITTPTEEVRRLIAHRLRREEKIHAALARQGPATLEALVRHAYDDVPERIHPVAMRSLHAHLLRLERNGRAAAAAGTWQAR